MKRILASAAFAFAILLLAPPASELYAQSRDNENNGPPVQARIVWFGVYQPTKTREIDDPTHPSGKRHVTDAQVPPKANSDRIPHIQGSRFGLSYRLTGARGKTIIKLRHMRYLPEDKVRENRNIPEVLTTTLDRYADDETLIGVVLGDEIQSPPGVWRFEVWQGNRKLLEKNFTVYLR